MQMISGFLYARREAETKEKIERAWNEDSKGVSMKETTGKSWFLSRQKMN